MFRFVVVIHPHLELGPDARHAEQQGRPRTLHVLDEGVQAFGEEHRGSPVERPHLDEHPLRHVAQRQVGEHPVVFASAEQFHAAAGGEGETAESSTKVSRLSAKNTVVPP